MSNIINRLIEAAAGACDFEADEGAYLRKLSKLAAAERETDQLWEQRARTAEAEVRKLYGRVKQLESQLARAMGE